MGAAVLSGDLRFSLRPTLLTRVPRTNTHSRRDSKRQGKVVLTAFPPDAEEKFNGRDALRRVRDGKPKMDAEHRVPTGSRSYDHRIFHSFPPKRRPGRDLSASVETSNRCSESGSLLPVCRTRCALARHAATSLDLCDAVPVPLARTDGALQILSETNVMEPAHCDSY